MSAKETVEKIEKPKDEPKPKVSMFELYRYATFGDYLLILVGFISAAANGATLPVMTIFFGDIIQALVIYDGSPAARIAVDNSVSDGVIKMCLVGLATVVFSYIQMCAFVLSGERQTKKIREKYFNAILRQDVAWFDKVSTGDLTNRLTADMTLIQEGMSDKVGLMIQFTCAFLSGFVIGYVRGWRLALVLTGTLPFLAGCAMYLAKLLASGTEEEQKAYAGAGDVAQQVISSIRTVVAFGGEDKEIKRYTDQLDEAERVGLKKALINGAGVGSIQLLVFLVYALAFGYGNTLVPGVMSTGEVLNVIFAIIIGAFSLGNATPHISAIGTAQGTAVHIFETIDRQSPIDPLSEVGEIPEKVVGNIEFSDIEFFYPSRPDVQVLKKFNLNVEAGKTVALVGSSGSGKSTMVKLLERFYDPSAGLVKLDGKDIKQLNVKWLRQQIGMVSQEVY
jgi:ATP-binding cassette subfamily B (MDR/TAP) protein 1